MRDLNDLFCLGAKPVPQPLSLGVERAGLSGRKNAAGDSRTWPAVYRRTPRAGRTAKRRPANADARPSDLHRPTRHGHLLPRLPGEMAPHSTRKPAHRRRNRVCFAGARPVVDRTNGRKPKRSPRMPHRQNRNDSADQLSPFFSPGTGNCRHSSATRPRISRVSCFVVGRTEHFQNPAADACASRRSPCRGWSRPACRCGCPRGPSASAGRRGSCSC